MRAVLPYERRMASLAATQSRTLTAIIYLHWLAPIGYLVALAALYNLPLGKLVAIFFSFYFIARSALSVYVGYLIYRARPWAWHIFLFNSGLLVLEQFYFAFLEAETHLVFPSLALAIAAIGLTIFLMKVEFRVPYFSPQIAWWESDPRYKISLPVQISKVDHSQSGEIMDISVSGCFAKTRSAFAINDQVSLRFSVFEHEFFLRGKIVWLTSDALTHPRGVGIRFTDIDREEHVRLKECVRKLRGASRKLQLERREERLSSIQEKLKAEKANTKDS